LCATRAHPHQFSLSTLKLDAAQILFNKKAEVLQLPGPPQRGSVPYAPIARLAPATDQALRSSFAPPNLILFSNFNTPVDDRRQGGARVPFYLLVGDVVAS